LIGSLRTPWINGRAQLDLAFPPERALVAPAGQSTITDTLTGNVARNANVTFRGLPVIGFSAQSYSTTGLPGINPSVLSNYGGTFVHKLIRRIEISP
jgi:hypothetical protein